MAARLQLADRILPYADLRWRPADPPAPALHLEDVSAIPFLTGIAGVEEYQHRARLRTAAGDAYAAVTGSEAAYDDYCTQRLRLAPVSRIPVRASEASSALAVAEGCMRGAAFERATALARRNGRLVIHPYMAIEPVWQLARRIAERVLCLPLYGALRDDEVDRIADCILRLGDHAGEVRLALKAREGEA